ncbi:MAG: DNA repair protein RadC [Ruminococcaceae bacterium]|nr:DNA repair protein RadC [Oscillospiraceae bacterium]
MKTNQSTPHAGHRARMKQRFLQEGFQNFQDHEILEFLLFYSIARQNTNELGHMLLDRFGSFHRAFDAPLSELLKLDGIGEHSAILLKIIPEICRRYRISKLENTTNMQSLDTAGEFLIEHYMPLQYEQVSMILLDNRQNMISFETIHNGSVNSSDINIRRIVEIAFTKGAASLILAHNHPNGKLIPSDADITTTKFLKNAFAAIDLKLREHILVAEGKFLPLVRYIAENAKFEPRYIALRANNDDLSDEEIPQ